MAVKEIKTSNHIHIYEEPDNYPDNSNELGQVWLVIYTDGTYELQFTPEDCAYGGKITDMEMLADIINLGWKTYKENGSR